MRFGLALFLYGKIEMNFKGECPELNAQIIPSQAHRC